MSWQMLPGETLNGLAALFYKGDRPMQQRFVAATLKLNRELQPIASGNSVFTSATQISIPDLKYLSAQSAPRKHAKPLSLETNPVIAAGQAAGIVDGAGVPPDMLAQYESLVKLNASLKAELERLNSHLRELQALAQELLKKLQALLALESAQKSKTSASQTQENKSEQSKAQEIPAQQAATQQISPQLAKPTASNAAPEIKSDAAKQASASDAPAEAAPKQFKQVDAFAAPANPALKPADTVQASADGNDIVKILIPVLLTLVAIGSFVLIYRWRINPLSRPTIMQQPSIQPAFRPTTQRGRTQQMHADVGVQDFNTANQPVTLPPAQQLTLVPAQPTRELLANARLLMGENKPEAALSMLQTYLDAYPEQSILPWLHALEIHHNMHHRKTFSQLADRMHDTFSEEIAAWNDAETGMSVESNAAEYKHIQDELEQIWLNDRAAFSTEVLKEIVVLQEVLKTRSQPSHQEKIPQLA